jgi:hypothetical protein
MDIVGAGGSNKQVAVRLSDALSPYQVEQGRTLNRHNMLNRIWFIKSRHGYCSFGVRVGLVVGHGCNIGLKGAHLDAIDADIGCSLLL